MEVHVKNLNFCLVQFVLIQLNSVVVNVADQKVVPKIFKYLNVCCSYCLVQDHIKYMKNWLVVSHIGGPLVLLQLVLFEEGKSLPIIL